MTGPCSMLNGDRPPHRLWEGLFKQQQHAMKVQRSTSRTMCRGLIDSTYFGTSVKRADWVALALYQSDAQSFLVVGCITAQRQLDDKQQRELVVPLHEWELYVDIVCGYMCFTYCYQTLIRTDRRAQNGPVSGFLPVCGCNVEHKGNPNQCNHICGTAVTRVRFGTPFHTRIRGIIGVSKITAHYWT